MSISTPPSGETVAAFSFETIFANRRYTIVPEECLPRLGDYIGQRFSIMEGAQKKFNVTIKMSDTLVHIWQLNNPARQNTSELLENLGKAKIKCLLEDEAVNGDADFLFTAQDSSTSIEHQIYLLEEE